MIPNLLSLLRIFLALPVLVFFSKGFYFSASVLFILAALTDLLDGFLARKYKLDSDLGSLLDLIADKILVAIVIIWLASYFKNPVLVIFSILIISRELIISHIRAFMAGKKLELVKMKADSFGKIKTFSQMTGISCLLVSPVFGSVFFDFSILVLLLSVILSYISLFNYFREWHD